MRRASVIESVARIVSLMFGGIFTGFLVTVLVLELSLRDFDAAVYTQVRQVELVRLDTLATATLVPTAVATLLLILLGLRRGNRAVGLLSVALVLMMIVFATTVAVNLPINSDQLDWSVANPPRDWASDRDRWQSAHAVRTVAATLAFTCLVLGSGVQRRLHHHPDPVSEVVETPQTGVNS